MKRTRRHSRPLLRLLGQTAAMLFFSGPVIHTVENLGDTPIHNLIVELKDEFTARGV